MSVSFFFALYFENKFGQVKTFHVDTVALQGDFVKAHRLERGRAGTDTAEVEAFHALDDTADGGEVIEVFAEGIA